MFTLEQWFLLFNVYHLFDGCDKLIKLLFKSFSGFIFKWNWLLHLYSKHRISVPMAFICTTFNINFGLLRNNLVSFYMFVWEQMRERPEIRINRATEKLLCWWYFKKSNFRIIHENSWCKWFYLMNLDVTTISSGSDWLNLIKKFPNV